MSRTRASARTTVPIREPAAALAAIEPRLLQRRLAVERQQMRRRRHLLAGAAAGAALVGATIGLTRSSLLNVDRVEIGGAGSTPAIEIERAAGFDHHPAMIDVDPRASTRAIEQLPWVARARVVRHWPGTVEVTVLERSAVAAVPAAGRGWVMVDTTGRILADDADPPAELIRLTTEVQPGAPGATLDSTSRGALRVLRELPDPLAARVSAMATTPDSMALTLDGRISVAFGPVADVGPKLVALTTLLERADLKGITGIDVRVPTAPVLTR